MSPRGLVPPAGVAKAPGRSLIALAQQRVQRRRGLAGREAALETGGDDAVAVDDEQPRLGLDLPLGKGRAGDLLLQGLGLVVQVDLGVDEVGLAPEFALDGQQLVDARATVAGGAVRR